MRFRLIPRDEGFYGLFCDAASNVQQGAELVAILLAELTDVESRVVQMISIERRGDELTHSIMERLERAIITPFDREDIHALAERLDDVVDHIRAAADLVQLHQVTEPLDTTVTLSRLLARASEANVRLVAKLPKLRDMQVELDEIDDLESEGDSAYRQGLARLYSGEFEALTVLRWQDIVAQLEEALDGIEKVSDLVASIAVKHA
jgi:predicted phosphate transport protein (TIGR00153 family)